MKTPSPIHPGEPADQAVAKLVDRYGDRIYALALRFCGGPDEAEDLVQQTFLNAFRRWKDFEGRSDPATWLYTIAARACQRQQRKRAGEPKWMEPLVEEGHDGEEVRGAVAVSSEETPDAARARREAREIVERGISRLPPEFRLPLVLKDIVEFSGTEIAEILGIKEETVKTRVHRARLKLRKEIESAMPREGEPVHPSQQICLDLLQAKQEALDHGADFPLPPDELCSRCRSVFEALDLGRDACVSIGKGRLPPELKAALVERVVGGQRGPLAPRAKFG